MTGRRSLLTALAAVAAGAGLTLLAGSRTWAIERLARPAPLGPAEIHRTGNYLIPWLLALALVGLAGAGAILATRGVARRIVGVVIAIAGVGVVVAAAGGFHYSAGWALLALIGGLGITFGGTETVRKAGTWAAMGARYERAGAAASKDRPITDATMWDDLDRGIDPTDR